jgi:HSP20 family molecular chaperone IbpA
MNTTSKKADYMKPIEFATAFNELFSGNPTLRPKSQYSKNFNVIENADGSNTIFINAVGYAKTDIHMEVISGQLVIYAKYPENSDLTFLPYIDYKFKLGYSFDEDGITATVENGVLSVVVKAIKKAEPIKKVINIA